MANVKKINCFWDENGSEYVQTEWSKHCYAHERPVLSLRTVFKEENLVTILDKRSAKELIEELQRFIDS